MGYHTLVGDMNAGISGGQRQRILLARALYKRPRILFLDEATSALDVDREREVNLAIRKLRLTRIIVAHRPETIASASRVIVLSEGRVAQDLRSVPGWRQQQQPRCADGMAAKARVARARPACALNSGDERAGHRVVVRRDGGGAGRAAEGTGTPRLLAQALHSQVEMHRAYGGVVPELASRDHIRRVAAARPAGAGGGGRRPRGTRRHRLHPRPRPRRRAAGRRRRGLRPGRGSRHRPPSACTISKATCCRRSSPPIRRGFPSSRCWCRVGTRS